MALMRTRSQLSVSSPPPLPSPIPRARGSRSAANEILTEIIEKSIQVPELTLPESHSGGESCGSRHLIPAEIDFRLLTSRREGSVDRLVRSAREFGAFRVSYHGISSEEMRSLVRESGRFSEFWRKRHGFSEECCRKQRRDRLGSVVEGAYGMGARVYRTGKIPLLQVNGPLLGRVFIKQFCTL
ncbi:hypothetical protein Bca52824_009177 [Brassica carinata]|uniref:Non-haem dioxygenase N-terminal domain-containing protein n=1 Tax=Brassica carinata TaxID=52824 RepID=A0A8X7WB77_BRACI|nr:hypothetical protein Bca52824_009177 [Brassica carinata]